MAEAEPQKTQDVIAEIQGEDVDENVQKLLKATADSLQKAKEFDCNEALIDEALELIRCQSSLSEIVRAVQLCFDLLIEELSDSEREISRLGETLSTEEKRNEVQNGVITVLRSGDPTAKSKSYEAQLANVRANVTLSNVRATRAKREADDVRKELRKKRRDCREQAELVVKLEKTIDQLKEKAESQRKAIVNISETRDDVLDNLVRKRIGAVLTKVEKLEKDLAALNTKLEKQREEDLAAANTKFEKLEKDLAAANTKLEQIEKRLIPLEANYEVVKAAEIIRSLENKIVPFRANGFLLRHLTAPKGYNESVPVSKQEFDSAVSEWQGKSYSASWDASYGDIFSTLIYAHREVDLKNLDFSLLHSTIVRKIRKPVSEDDVKAAFEWIAMTLEQVK
ncbi:tropomyosin alpha-1 chain-like [Oscarella lobularis]|uniref:tropomyosin alpha-1 chain-like n=1 Tax=Oscarella lobularis TaxID=121494 RepID=UPI003313FDAC